jgi:hypothetical protein
MIAYPKNTQGPWGFVPKPSFAMPQQPREQATNNDIKPFDWLDYTGTGLNQRWLGACGAYSRVRCFTTHIRATCGLGQMPWGYAIDPLPLWEQAKILDGSKPYDNVGVSSAKIVLQAAIDLGIIPPTTEIQEISLDAKDISNAIQTQPICIAFACHKGFFPENLAINGAVAESLGPTPLDFMSGHLINCTGLVHSASTDDTRPILYNDETWGPDVGFKGGCFEHLDHMVRCALENIFIYQNVDWTKWDGWKKFVTSFANIDKQMIEHYPKQD